MKDVLGWEGIYGINDSCEIVNLKTGWIKIPTLNKARGYYYVCLKNGDRKRTYAYHRILAESLLPKPDGYHEVNHIDGDKKNNRIENLEWVTRSENHKHAYRLGLQTVNRPSSLKYEDILEIRRLRESGLLHREIAVKFNVAVCTITLILLKKRWNI